MIQSTLAGFTRSASRRMDTELCILNLCQPELKLDSEAINARLTRMEEQLRSGVLVAKAPAQPEEEDERPPLPDDEDAPPVNGGEAAPAPIPSETPMGFWMDLVGAVRQELKPSASGFFVTVDNAPVKGQLQGDTLTLVCNSAFTCREIEKPETLEVVARKASALLGRPIRVKAVDGSAQPGRNEKMERLMDFGRANSDIVKIRY